MCNNRCECCNRFIKSTAIDIVGDTLQITIPQMTFTRNCEDFCLVLTQPIPPLSEGLQVVILNGTTTIPVFENCGNFLLGFKVQCRKKYKIRYGNNPVHFTLLCCK